MSSGLSRRELLMAGGAAWLGAGAMGRVLARPQGADQEGALLHQERGLPPPGRDSQSAATAQPGRAGPHQGRQGARLRGRRLQGRAAVRARQDRRVGRLRLRDHRRPDHRGQVEKSPPISPKGEKAFYDAIRGGKGFLGMHCAADTFGHFAKRNKGAEDPYIQMIGGEFIIARRPSRKSRSTSSTPSSPASRTGFGSSGPSFRITDEWYALKNMPDDLHVIMVQVTKGMRGQDVPAAQLSDDLGAELRQGPRLLHLDGPPRGHMVKPDVPGAPARRTRAGRPAAWRPTSSPTSARSRRTTTSSTLERTPRQGEPGCEPASAVGRGSPDPARRCRD